MTATAATAADSNTSTYYVDHLAFAAGCASLMHALYDACHPVRCVDGSRLWGSVGYICRCVTRVPEGQLLKIGFGDLECTRAPHTRRNICFQIRMDAVMSWNRNFHLWLHCFTAGGELFETGLGDKDWNFAEIFYPRSIFYTIHSIITLWNPTNAQRLALSADVMNKISTQNTTNASYSTLGGILREL